MIKSCSCKHDFQDAKYGKGMRVHNESQGGKLSETKWSCTVCGNVKEFGSDKKK